MPTEVSTSPTARAAETAARSSYGRLLAILTARSGDVSAAEDALAEAFVAALSTWGDRGVPAAPDAWLLSTARRKLVDEARHISVRKRGGAHLRLLAEEVNMARGIHDLPDRRLELMLLCAHPAIETSVRTPLMLQTVLGLDANHIAAAFMVPPSTMSQRLVRAKAKIKTAGIPFGIPEAETLPERLDAVLTAIYAAYNVGWEDMARGADRHAGLSVEAEWLARLVNELAPNSAETKGLLALILFCESRRPARRAPDGTFIPLSEQDTSRWNIDMIDEAQHLLLSAARNTELGRYQLEAGIQSVHAHRHVTGQTAWPTIVSLYDVLLRQAPSLGAEVARAAALGEAKGSDTGLAALRALPSERLRTYPPYWATKGHLLARGGHYDAAETALRRAADLTNDAASKAWLLARAQKL